MPRLHSYLSSAFSPFDCECALLQADWNLFGTQPNESGLSSHAPFLEFPRNHYKFNKELRYENINATPLHGNEDHMRNLNDHSP